MGDDRGRILLRHRSSTAFAPAVITNFFKIEYISSEIPAGATGGGYILSNGTLTTASSIQTGSPRVTTRVNGDPSYDARTTRRAVELMLDSNESDWRLGLVQEVETPIGAGFGSSGASATSAVYASAAAIGAKESKRDLAMYAHRAEILEQTGLGTVSVNYNHVGAGAITIAGEPGVAKFVSIRIPKDIRLVTAYFAPFNKKDAFSSRSVSEKINRLGAQALAAFVSVPTLDTLGSEGEIFSRRLGLESPEVRKLIAAAKGAGAIYASQNMIGYSVHSVVPDDKVAKVAKAFRSLGKTIRVDQFEIGKRRAGLVPTRK